MLWLASIFTRCVLEEYYYCCYYVVWLISQVSQARVVENSGRLCSSTLYYLHHLARQLTSSVAKQRNAE